MDVVAVSGLIVALLALAVAWVQLTRIREERQRNFLLTQLVDLADALQEFGGAAPDRVRVRVRVLPPELLPVARAWVDEGDRHPSSLVARFEGEGRDGQGWGNWVRDRVRDEVYAAVAALLSARAHSRRLG